MYFFQFDGAPCLQHTNYVFYKAFKYKVDDQYKVLTLGDFFFLKILQEIPVCIGEIELLWEDKASNQLLSSLRLYFRPEHTPEGRLDDTGEDEVVALGERLVLRLDDLVPLIQSNIPWDYGSSARCASKRSGAAAERATIKSTNDAADRDQTKDATATTVMAGAERSNGKDSRNGTKSENNSTTGDDTDGGDKPASDETQKGPTTDVTKSKGCDNNGKQDGRDCVKNGGCDDVRSRIVVKAENGKTKSCSVALVKLENSDIEINKPMSGAANLAVMSYPKYCRYRALRRRLEGCENEWLHLAVVNAIGGFSGRAPGCRVMFCRDTFYQAEIDDLDIRMDHMLPTLKSRTKGKKNKQPQQQLVRKDSQQDSDSMEELFANITPSISSSSRPRRSTESSEINEDKVSTEEQAFLIGLHKFMHEAKMPIGRIPSLGFKQIDLFYFYKQAEKLGGYDSITHKRMWKHLYDKLGGNSSNTSAATCTRKHYERLLLPYERHLRKLKLGKQKKKLNQFKLEAGGSEVKVEPQDGNGHSSQKENIEVKAEVEVKHEEIVIDDEEGDAGKEDMKRMTYNEASGNFKNDSVNRKDKFASGTSEHSKQESQGDSQVLEVPVLRQRVSGSSSGVPAAMFPSLADLKGMDGQNLSYSQLEQLQQQMASKAGLASSMGSSGVPYGNMMYRGGYLMPMLPPHMLQSQWGLLGPPSSSPSSSSSHATTKDSSSTPKVNQNAGGSGSAGHHDNRSKSRSGLSGSRPQQPSPSGSSSSGLKAAHTNMPYKPSPYLLNDHIQPGRTTVRRATHSSQQHFHATDLLANSSHNLAPILHPKPKGHRNHPHLPPAPSQLYLHPSSTNPYHPIQYPSISSTPQPAHNQPRKRAYPFDSPGAPPTLGNFPSPDMVLNRIKNSTGLPLGHATLPQAASAKQRFDNPRDIFRQAPDNSSSPGTPQRRPHQDSSSSSSKQSNSKSKSSSSSSSKSLQSLQSLQALQSLPSPFGHLTASDHQQTLLQQGHGIQPTSSKAIDQLRAASNSNGLMGGPSGGKGGQQQASPIPSASKDGRLTSALFGNQFTALPRSLMADPAAAAAALAMNPHLHPAFMNFLPTSTSSASALNPQLQMLASAYGSSGAQLAPFGTSPAQLAAYEELLRQNGYGAFLAAGAPPTKSSKKN